MKWSILVLGLLGVSFVGCTYTVNTPDLNRGEAYCSKRLGIDRFYNFVVGDLRVVCRDGSEATTKAVKHTIVIGYKEK